MNVRGVIVRVIDGDTIWVRVRVRLRTSAPDHGVEALRATEITKRRFPRGRRVQLSIGATDQFGRFIADILPDTSQTELPD